jgi:hypothetical protein
MSAAFTTFAARSGPDMSCRAHSSILIVSWPSADVAAPAPHSRATLTSAAIPVRMFMALSLSATRFRRVVVVINCKALGEQLGEQYESL